MDETGIPFRLAPEAELALHSPLLDIFRRMTRAGPHTALAAGRPPDDALPLERWQECFDYVLARDGAAALQYQLPDVALREWLADWMRTRGLDCAVRRRFSSPTATSRACSSPRARWSRRGSTRLIERPTYTGILDVVQKRGIALRAAPIRPDIGLDLAAWRAACLAEPRPALAFTIADFHNPTAARADGPTRAAPRRNRQRDGRAHRRG